MGKIKILSEKMAKLISAGEVVEKPASIVKELVENCIDAGATSVTIEVFNGGQSDIIISDNGSGMSEDDIKLSILPHATSKIEFPEDLNAIATLGFRGEALSSICAVSQVSIMSKTKHQDLGSLAKIEEGIIVSLENISCEVGTRIQVSNLFYNTPVRRKFLRKPKSDEADITDYIEKLMLAYSNVSFKYYIDGKLKYNTMGSGLFDNVYTIYGKEVADNCVKIDIEKDNYHLYGYIGKPIIAKPNRNYQTLLICGRYVKSPMISTSISNAYENFLMKGKFPFYVLFLDLPLDSLDVNIHPNKLEVKFEKPNFIYSLVSEAVSKALYEVNYEKSIEIVKNEESLKVITDEITDDFGVSFKQSTVEEVVITSNNNFENELPEVKYETKIQNDNQSFNNFNQNQNIIENIVLKKPDIIQKLDSFKSDDKKTEFVNYQVIGRIFETYILLQLDDCLYIIDQHAAHERILFDKFIREIENTEIAKQDMIFPYSFNVKDKDFTKVLELLPLLTQLGFEIYEFGQNSFKIDSVPVLLQNINLKDFVDTVLAENFVNKNGIDLIRDKVATLACRSAVKAGDKLTEQQIEYIVEKIQEGLLICPHGRPFVIKVTKTQIEKWFGRIV